MAPNTTTDDGPSTPTPTGLGTHDVPRVGIDGEGARHYYDEAGDRVLVERDGSIEHTEHLEGRPLSDWQAFVADRRGWTVYGDAQFTEALSEVGA